MLTGQLAGHCRPVGMTLMGKGSGHVMGAPQ